MAGHLSSGMRALALLVAALTLAPGAAAQQPEPAGPAPGDTARPGDPIRFATSPAGPWRTLRFVGASPDSVFLGASGGWLRTGVSRTAVGRVQVLRPSGRGAVAGAGAGAVVGGIIAGLLWLPLTRSPSFDLSASDAIAVGLALVAIPAGIGALLGQHERPQAWRDGVLPAGPVTAPGPADGVPVVSVYLFAGRDVESGRLEELGRRLAAAGVGLGRGETSLAEPWPAPTEVRYFAGRDAETAEALAFWLARVLSQPTRTRLQRVASAFPGELQVWLAR